MQIPRTLAVLAVLLAAVAAWLIVSTPPPEMRVVQGAQMAPATVGASGGLPTHPPQHLAWRPLDQQQLAEWRGPYWLRWQVPAPESGADHGRTVRLSLRAASQLYWNGMPWISNGAVGRTPEEEKPGRVDVVRVLPPPSGNATDELLVLASSQQQRFALHGADAMVLIAPAPVLYGQIILPWLIAAFATGALAAACLYFLAVLRGQTRTPGARLLLALGVVGLALPAVEAWRSLLGYTYPWHGVRLVALLALHVTAALLLPAYLARRFEVPLPRAGCFIYLALIMAAAIALPGFDTRSAAVLLLSLLVSAWVLMRAPPDQEDRWPILALLSAGLLALLVARGAFLDGPYFLLLAVLMVFLLLRHAAQLQALDRHNAWLREERARLSLQLLQRGIQPHWLMNTLTCLQELIEQSPMRASRLVESLADQFDRLRDSSSRQSVPLQDELALCRSHLDIVGLALDRRMVLEVDGEDAALSLPPGILHAQVENALTHAGAGACALHPFRLHVQRDNARWILELRSARGSAPHRGRGTGTRYIEASLAAASPTGWSFVQGIDGDHWCGRIELTCAS
ncbi:histidine kinase [Stenotrophomonas lactitubi]|uniref:Histidine kinase n=2 Tax=Lysobacteraceae TaxID=32033 RepID=A0AAW4GJZ7_9GAMM|nr:histidine kinase [Stenotrophomonas lactitubi]MBM9923837.1 histidine kinase [Stenotrophomonas lactitubi]MBM9940606.1 histidine kinase [Stenotrophomonas lactitubi]